MANYQLFSPKQGRAENVPGMLLSEAFLAAESVNVHEFDQEYRRLPGRLYDFVDDNGDPIQLPTIVHAVTATDAPAKEFTIDGAHKAAIEAALVDGQVRLNGATNNDGIYTVDTITEVAGPNTEIVVLEALVAEGVAEGSIFAGGTPALIYHRHPEPDNTERLLVGTAYHVFLWFPVSKVLTLKFTSGTPASVVRMEMVSHLWQVYMTNNVDKIQWWDIIGSIGNNFAPLGAAGGVDIDGGPTYMTAAKHVASHKGYLWFANVTVTSDPRPTWAYRSSRRDPTDFDINSDGDAGLHKFDTTPDQIMGFGIKGNSLIVAKQFTEMIKLYLTPDAIVYTADSERIKVGCLSADTLINDKEGRLFWLASDFTIREIDTVGIIADPAEVTLKGINPAFAEFAKAMFIKEYNQIWFAIPEGDSETNSRVLALDVEGGRVFKHEIAVSAFGVYSRQEVVTYDTLPYLTWEEWGIAWMVYDTNVNVVGFGLDLAGDYNGFTYDLHAADKDAGEDFTGVIAIETSLTNPKEFISFKRVNSGIEFLFNRLEGGTVDISVKKENAKTAIDLGTISLSDSSEPKVVRPMLKNVNFRARFFKMILTSTSGFQYIGTIFQNFVFDGTR